MLKWSSGFLILSFLVLVSCKSNSSNPPVLLGEWHLESITKYDSLSGKWVPSTWMKDGEGILYYGSDGHMNVHFTPRCFKEDSCAEKPYWYVAKYSWDSKNNICKHTRILHSNPEEIGEVVNRKLEIKNDVLTMWAEEYQLRLLWTRSQ